MSKIRKILPNKTLIAAILLDQHIRCLEHMPCELGFRGAELAQPGEEMALETPDNSPGHLWVSY